MESVSHFTLPKRARLSGKINFDLLFEHGKSFYNQGCKIQYRIFDNAENIKPALRAGFVVSRRNFKRANLRNLLRRRMKEAYRLQYQNLIHVPNGLQVHILIIYNTKQIKAYSVIYDEVRTSLGKLNDLICAHS